MLLDLLPDGSGLARPRTQAPPSASKAGRAKAPLVRIDLVTGRLSSIVIVPDAEFVLTTSSRGYERPSVVGLGLRASIAHFGGRLFYGSGESLAVDEYDLTGQVVGTFERPYDRRPVTMADREAEAALFLGQQPADMQTPENRKALRAAPYSDLMPALGSSGEVLYAPPTILLDEMACLWVQEYAGPRDTTRTWSVFSADRAFLGTLSLPRAFMIHKISRDQLLGVHEDSLGVQTVQAYAMHRDDTCGATSSTAVIAEQSPSR
jgi:hypothetical protein